MLLAGSGRSYPLLPGLFIDGRFVVGILVFERVVCFSSQTCVGFGAQYLLQRRYGADVPRLVTQPAYGMLSHTSIRV